MVRCRRFLIAASLASVAGCPHPPPKNTAVTTKAGKHTNAAVNTATFVAAKSGGVVRIEFGLPPAFALEIPNCYAHAKSRIGDRDHVKVERLEDHAEAIQGELDIEDCLTQHVTATLHARFPDDVELDAVIDTPLAKP